MEIDDESHIARDSQTTLRLLTNLLPERILTQVTGHTYHHELYQLCPRPFQFQHITTAKLNHGLLQVSSHQEIGWDDHSATLCQWNPEEELGRPSLSLDLHQGDTELQPQKHEKILELGITYQSQIKYAKWRFKHTCKGSCHLLISVPFWLINLIRQKKRATKSWISPHQNPNKVKFPV